MKKIVIIVFSTASMASCTKSSQQSEAMNESDSQEIELGEDFSIYAQLYSMFKKSAPHSG
jgi:hypothetical protein